MTVFFYCQHYRVVKRYDIDKLITLNDVTVWIKEMSIENYRPGKRQQEMLSEYKGPWYLEAAQKLPRPLQIPFIKVCHLYTMPYEFDKEFGTLRVKGLYLYQPAGIIPEDHNSLRDLGIDIYLYDEEQRYYGRSMETQHHNPSNYYLFSLKGEMAPLHKNSYRVVIKDNRNNDLHSFIISPQWEKKTYTYFDRTPEQYQFDPFNIIHKFLSPLRQGKKEEGRKYILAGAEEKRVWAALDHGYWEMDGIDYVVYEERRGAYENVYSSNITFGHMPDTGGHPEDLVPVASQKIYFVIRDNSPLVIDADPVTVLSNRN